MNYQVKDLYNTLFIDIETVSCQKEFDELSEPLKPLWIRKAKSLDHALSIGDSDAVAMSYKQRAAIYAEFGKIICVSVGFIHTNNELRIKSLSGHNEVEVLTQLSAMLEDYYYDTAKHYIAGHNIKEFDVPYICRRMLINGLPLPKIFNIMSKKPWQTEHLVDTLEMWKFGDSKSFISLNLMCAILGIDSPKSDLDGSMVGHAYWEQDRLADIATYCSRDVEAVARIVCRLTGYADPADLTVHHIAAAASSEEE